ncbi:MAG: hypothetical protein KKB50_21105 [Planctomycetes bacterium]|nr:hypothetical protein [Planctomycetota bacterium]
MAQNRRSLLLGGVGVAAIVVAAVMFFGGYGRAPSLPDEYGSACVCLSCKEEVKVTYGRDEYPPFTCPLCSAQSAYPWLYCQNCKHRFVPDLVRPDPDGPLRVPGHPVCRKCGSGNVGSYAAGMPGQEPVGDAPLPDWSP